jgi:hypothetical protein
MGFFMPADHRSHVFRRERMNLAARQVSMNPHTCIAGVLCLS